MEVWIPVAGAVILAALGVVLGIIGFFVKRLIAKHDEMTAEIAALKIQVAVNKATAEAAHTDLSAHLEDAQPMRDRITRIEVKVDLMLGKMGIDAGG